MTSTRISQTLRDRGRQACVLTITRRIKMFQQLNQGSMTWVGRFRHSGSSISCPVQNGKTSVGACEVLRHQRVKTVGSRVGFGRIASKRADSAVRCEEPASLRSLAILLRHRLKWKSAVPSEPGGRCLARFVRPSPEPNPSYHNLLSPGAIQRRKKQVSQLRIE